MTRPNYALLVSNLILLALIVLMFVAGNWIAGLVVLALLAPPTVYWHLTPKGRARRRSSEPIEARPAVFAIGAIILGLFWALAPAVRWEVTGEDPHVSIVVWILAPAACWLLAFRPLTGVRLRMKLEKMHEGCPVMWGTGDSIASRLRAFVLDQEGIVTVEASAFGTPRTFERISLSEISAVEEPSLDSVRVVTKDGGGFWVQRGSPRAARRLTAELHRRLAGEDRYSAHG